MGRFGSFLRGTGRVFTKLVQYGCTVYCASYAATPSVCQGSSMEPTIYPDNVIVYEAITALGLTCKRGDVVVVQGKDNPKLLLCKRLIALEHERVFNNKSGEITQVPKGHVWLEGDNQLVSSDSRDMGPFPYALIRGRVYLMLSPTLKMVR